MRIEAYFQHVREAIDTCQVAQSSDVAYDKRSTHEGFITGHRRKLHLSTYPHHKHAGSEDNVIASHAPDLAAVLNEVETLMQLPQ